jgi:tetratricopeptide (TPR) repeat protein
MTRPAAAPPAARIALAVALALAAAPAGAADDPAALLARARELAVAGRCREAVPLLEQARAALPADAAVADLLGQCQMQLQRWEQAAAAFAEAKRLDPETPSVDIHLAASRFHAGDLAGAEAALDDARVRSPGSAEVDLYDGLIRLERAEEPVAAAEALERARGRDPVGVEPVASYYAGIAWLRARERERAREALARVQQEAAGTEWATAAARALADAEGRTRGLRDRRDLQGLAQAERPLGRGPEPERGREGPWISVSGGIEYDDNVLLRGNGVQVPDEISDEGDARTVWTAQVGTELFRNRDWTIGALAAWYGSAHFDLTDFDTHYPSITTWVDRRIGEAWVARLQYDFSYAWVGGDAYLREHSVLPALFHDWGGRRGTTRLFGELTWDDYRFEDDDVPDGFPPGSGGGPGTACPDPSRPCGPFGLDESRARNRDGFWWNVGFEHVVPVAELRSELSLGYRYHQYDAEGREYDFQAHEVEVGARTLLPWRLVLDLQGRFAWRPYEHPSTYPDPSDLAAGLEYGLRSRDKRENVWQASAILERPIADWLVASLRYEYTRNDANVDVFDFDRHVVGGYLTVFYRPSF